MVWTLSHKEADPSLPPGPAQQGIRRSLGLWQVTVTGVGVILGAGALVGQAARLAGGALWLAFLLAGITAGLTAYTYARMVTVRPKSDRQ